MKLPSYEKLKISKISRSLQGRESGSDINQRSVRGLTNMMGRSNMGRAKSNTRKRGFEAERQVLQVDSLKENKTNEFCLKIIDVRAQITETMIRSDTRVCLKLNKTSKFRQDRIIKSTRSSYKQSTLSFTIFLAATFIFISLLVPIQDARANQIESSEHLWEEERQQKQQQQVNDYNINKNQQDLKSSASEYGRISVDGRGFSGSQLKDSVRKRSADIRMSEVDEVSSGQSNNNKAKLGPLGCKQDCSEHNQFRNKRDVGISSQQSGFASNQNEANLPTCNQLVSSWTYLKNKFPALAARLSNVGSAQGRRRALSLNSISKQTELNFLLERANRLLAEDVGGQQDSSTRSRVAKLLANYMLNPNNAKFLRRYQLLESVRSKYHPLGENVHENHPSISLTPFNDASRSSGVENENNNINGHERAQSSGESTSINTKSNSNSNNNNIISSNEGNEPQRDINLLDSRGRYNTQLSDMPAQTDFKISNRKEPQNYTYGRVINYPHERQSQSSGITTGKIHKLHHITRLIETRAHHNNNHNNRSPENEMHFKVVEPDMVVDRLDNGNDLLNNEQRNQANESPTWPQVEEPQLQAAIPRQKDTKDVFSGTNRNSNLIEKDPLDGQELYSNIPERTGHNELGNQFGSQRDEDSKNSGSIGAEDGDGDDIPSMGGIGPASISDDNADGDRIKDGDKIVKDTKNSRPLNHEPKFRVKDNPITEFDHSKTPLSRIGDDDFPVGQWSKPFAISSVVADTEGPGQLFQFQGGKGSLEEPVSIIERVPLPRNERF